ncbi:CHASE2 domain-containing protein [Leptolyngbya sp. FACHB-671]|uniref:sensor histidine kinase n=1 Tax=Leptolyngbya sp. FACHB-671 TaxID=2692812 RepID=UPI001681F451|nr:CHASE2 domain-containing protein [Leptolyngbya sp. FACHB-671]MBD2070513.1 CHASE2 domain-containing protein [Leptolyngbya sp. FACHB-671]
MRTGQGIWAVLQRELQLWRSGALPGLAVIGLVVALRLVGGLQMLEWFALDYLLRLRPPESTDEHILIVGIDEDDIQAVGQYPIPDGELADLIQTLNQSEPAVIGLDIFRDLPQEPGHQQLADLFRTTPNLIGIERIFPRTIAPPPALPAEQVGFADLQSDPDGKLRRNLLGAYDAQEEFSFSLAIRVAGKFLGDRNLPLESGLRDPYALRFGKAELPRIQPNTGGYRNLEKPTDEVDTFINYRSGGHPFEMVSLRAVLAGEVPDELVRDRIVLIGVVAPSVKDIINTVAVSSMAPNPAPGIVYGVEVQAHTISQIVQAALYQRPLLNSWGESWEYLWIAAWGILGISLGRFLGTPWRVFAGLSVSCAVFLGVSYWLLVMGWWVPLVPPLIILLVNGAGLTTALFYRYQQDLKQQLRDRQYVIDHTFNAIHNGPLQTLSLLLRKTQSGDLELPQIEARLKDLNQELRAVYELVRQEVLTRDENLHLAEDQAIALTESLDEVLYEVYSYTLKREFDYFKALKFSVTTFEPLDTTGLTLEHKRNLGRFLEESLCNVGKYAAGATRLDVTCKQEEGWNVIRVMDNGKGFDPTQPTTGGRGTQLAKNLEQQLGGQFRREFVKPKGTLCELKWKAAKIKSHS